MARAFVMEFERPVVELEQKLEALKRLDLVDQPELAAEIAALEVEIEKLRETLYASLSAWERVQVSRHPERPKTQDYVEGIFTDVVELHGDRLFGDDAALFTALATIGERRVVLLGHSKGRNTKENIARNFGSPHPEGFRKARRAMRLADRFGLPIVSLLDTAGAYPGIEDEERGQALAIAECLATLAAVRSPVVVVGIGEGGSGGALAIGFGDRLIMLENAYYSVISPEMCATILHKDAARASEAAACLQATADDLVRLGLADEIVSEPRGGAHRDRGVVLEGVRQAVTKALDELSQVPSGELVQRRYERLRKTGVYTEGE
jgi:acetyl-CoA carboxylase carboxyl transferase subunit alpha